MIISFGTFIKCSYFFILLMVVGVGATAFEAKRLPEKKDKTNQAQYDALEILGIVLLLTCGTGLLFLGTGLLMNFLK